MTTIRTIIEQLPTFKDSNGNEFVNAVPKALLVESANNSDKLEELEQRFNDLLGEKTVRIEEMARILGVSVHTINLWKTRKGYLKEGFHFEKRGGQGIFYNVKNMRKFKLEEAMAEKLAQQTEEVKNKMAELQAKQEKLQRRKSKIQNS